MRRKFPDSSMEELPIFGISFDPVAGTWAAFNQDTRTVLSAHKSEAQAHAACRRYEDAAFRRLLSSPVPVRAAA